MGSQDASHLGTATCQTTTRVPVSCSRPRFLFASPFPVRVPVSCSRPRFLFRFLFVASVIDNEPRAKGSQPMDCTSSNACPA
jgi:hypothetical protein